MKNHVLVFCDFSWPRVSWKLMKKGKPYFCDFWWTRGHENWWKMESLIFVIFCDPRVMIIDEKLCALFLWFFVIPGSWKLIKNQMLIFCDFSWPGVMKIDKKPNASILWFFVMTPGSWKLMKNYAPDICDFSWKLIKNRKSDFCDFSWPRGHENWWKMESDFCDFTWKKPNASFLWFFVTLGS